MPKPLDKLVNRLSEQVGDKSKAIAILKGRGDLTQKGEHLALTPHGLSRANMSAAERAIDRAAKYSGKPKGSYTYNPKTNRATLGKGKSKSPWKV